MGLHRLFKYAMLAGMAAVVIKALLVLLTHIQTITSDNKQPHILFILADDYGWNDIGYHNPDVKTPALDRLARDGVILDNYYVQPVCTPSRLQLLTGRYQIHLGLQHSLIWPPQPSGLPLEHPTLAERLRDAGYATHIVGKWHLGFYREEYTPTGRGFDTFFGVLGGKADHYTFQRCGGMPGWQTPAPLCGVDLHANDNVVWDNTEYSTSLFARKAQEVIEKHDTNKPMFLYLPLTAVHNPLKVPKKYSDMYPDTKDHNRTIYSGMTTCMDEAIQNITDTLKAKGMWDNTLLVFSSDNGGQNMAGGNNWPLRGQKGTLWEGGIRAVGFLHGQMIKHKGTVSRALIHISDWFPTLLHLAGVGTEDLSLDGSNVWESLSGGAPSPRKEILHNIDPLYERKGKNSEPGYDVTVHSAIRVGDWKLLTGDPGNGSWIAIPQTKDIFVKDNSKSDQNIWLFNITADPQEKNDLSAQHPGVVQKLLRRLAEFNSTALPIFYPPPDPNSDPALNGGAWGPWIHPVISSFHIHRNWIIVICAFLVSFVLIYLFKNKYPWMLLTGKIKISKAKVYRKTSDNGDS